MSAKKDFVFLPALTWFLTLFVAYKLRPVFEKQLSEDYWVFIVIFIIVERLAVAIGIVEICKKHLLNSDKWFLASLVFGATTLLFVNIKIWLKSSKK